MDVLSLGTIDAIFALQSIVDKTLASGHRLYCCFVDYTKAFDSVERTHLWYKLIKLGIRGKILKVIKSLYSNIKSSVLLNDKFSLSFANHLGVLQGEILSPILFSLYVNGFEEEFLNCGVKPTELQELSLFLLMYADDMILFSESVDELQKMLNMLSIYSDKWSLSVNVFKTKTMVFRKGGHVRPNEKWSYKGTELDCVDKFNYLGMLCNFNGKSI